MGQLPQRDRLDRWPNPEVAGLGRRHASCICNDLSHGQSALAALTRPHTAATEALGLIGTSAANAAKAAQVTRRDLFAPADDRAICRNAVGLLGAVQGVEKGADEQMLTDLSAQWLCQIVPNSVIKLENL